MMHFMRAVPAPSLRPLLHRLQLVNEGAFAHLVGEQLPPQLLQLAQLPSALGGIGLPNLPHLGIIARTTALRTIERLSCADNHLRQACHAEQPFLIAQLRPLVPVPPQGLIGDLERDSPGVSIYQLQKQLRRAVNNHSQA
eukprot:6473770-Amphidinium_carterae.2